MKKSYILGGIGLVVVVISGSLLWYLFSPLFINQTVNEDFPSQTQPQINEPGDSQNTTSKSEKDPATEIKTDDPMLILQGQFEGVDASHTGSGLASLYQLPDESYVLRFEDFSVTNGPDLHVYLTNSPASASTSDLGDYVDLGSLKGNQGNQNYDIPAGVDVSQFQSVLIYCQPFSVVFATATFKQ